jgi:uncharacterized protein
MPTQLSPQYQDRLRLSRSNIIEFCQRWQIFELSLFGSILREDFREDSDIDLLLNFAPQAKQGLLTLAKIKDELESISGRSVDIAIKASVENSENWIRRAEILNTAQVIYEQR